MSTEGNPGISSKFNNKLWFEMMTIVDLVYIGITVGILSGILGGIIFALVIQYLKK